MSEARAGGRRFGPLIETAVCVGLIALVSLYALWRMDYLGADTAHHIRLTDNSRSAFVAKNIADGRGYTTNDLPAALIDFYDERGKLHDANWVNADRFPFTAYAIAALYKVTGSTSEQVGILFYNLLCFVAFMVVLYRLARRLWGNPYSPLLALAIALLHPYTYIYLYLKDADMLLLTAAALALFQRYFERPPGTMSWKLALGLGTVLAWLFLARPNLGLPFILFFGLVMLKRLWRSHRDGQLVPALRAMLRGEILVAVTVAVWFVPFVIHSMSEWGSPMFSANNLYQLPLGTRFGMGTDTWWKYTDPSQSLSMGLIFDGAGDQVWSKFTSSWLATLKLMVASYGVEILLALGLFMALARRRSTDSGSGGEQAANPLRMIAAVTGFAVLINLALLPLYGYQNYAYRHYLGFVLPLLWLAGGHAIYLLAQRCRPAIEKIGEHLRAHSGAWILVAIVAVVAWNFGAWAVDGNSLFVRTSQFFAKHWLSAALLMLALLGHRWILRRPAYPRIVLFLVVLVIARLRPYTEVKRLSLNFFPANPEVWNVLRERRGIVSSFALQGEVAWASGRKNIPAPEFPMHLYSYGFDHGLVIEDVYIESADAMLGSFDGPFSRAAPGFEGYARLQRYKAPLPGYEVVFHEATSRGYAKYKVKPRGKASTIYRLVDRSAIEAIRHSPDRIELGEVRAAIHAAHGFDAYYTIDGKQVLAATDVSRQRYVRADEGPWEDAGITFFLDDRRPAAVELEIYATHATTFRFYWNLDLYQYDRPRDRGGHEVGTFTATGAGWQTIRLEVPQRLTRQGLNKLGFRADGFLPVATCPDTLDLAACAALRPAETNPTLPQPVTTMRLPGATGVTNVRLAMLVHALQFRY
jgi:hypothetical protein